MRDQQSRFRKAQFLERRNQRLRLVRFELPPVHDGQLLVRKLRGKRRTQCAKQHLFWQRIAIAARARSVNRSTMAPQRRPDRADTRAAGALLLPELAASARHFALFLDLVSAPAEPVQVSTGSFVQ